jgi:phosphate transport system substrate-binding protein
MSPSKRALAIVALTTTIVSCSGHPFPATTPTTSVEALRVYATTATYPLATDLTTAYNEANPLQGFDIYSANYQTVLERLRNYETPYFLSNHLSAESDLWAAPIGQDGIAIIVNSQVDRNTLSINHLRAIYQGHITSWSDLDGEEKDIVVFSRELGSGTRAEFEAMVMGYRRTTPNATIAASSAHMIEQVAQTPGSIGYVSMGHLDDRVKALAIDNILPTPETVFNNRYPLRATIFVVGLNEPEDRYRLLIGWMQSPLGQAVVAQHYAPLVPASALE